MKKLKFCVLTLLSFLVLSCQKEELNTSDVQDAQLKFVNLTEKFNIPDSSVKMSSQEANFTLYRTEPNTLECSLNPLDYNNLFGISLVLSKSTYNYFGGYFSNPGGMKITVQSSPSYSVIYEETINSGEEIFRAFSFYSEGNIVVNVSSLIKTNILSMRGKYGNCELEKDSDEDGCLDGNDSIPSSNMEETVFLHDCDSQVENRVTSECGVMMSDIIDQLEEGTYRNHGAFMKEVAHLTETWFLEGLITEEEKDALVSCAGQSN